MASKANQRRKGRSDESGAATQLCSINSTGLVFISAHRLPLSAELTLAIETNVCGLIKTWNLRGWVVECRQTRASDSEPYKVTLLFSNTPKGLQEALVLASEDGSQRSYPAADEQGIFGLN